MTILRSWLNAHKFQLHALAFGLMIGSPVFMFFAAQHGAIFWIWVWLAIFVLGNLLALSVP